jgi:UDP-2,3-diacylglucosamine pyrophosphatase LpxH
MAASAPYNLLALSDLHLGSDLVHHVRPEAPRRSRASARCDRELGALFDWYRENRVEGRPWRLIIGGDFVDFSGMSVMTDEKTLRTPPTEEERSHGLGGTPDHTLQKLRLVLEHHAGVMASLARFLAAGNTLVIVQGNHDVDWHWRSVQREFRKALEKLAAVPRDAVRFAPWFYYEKGFFYLEHGHQYDPCCSYEHVLYPVSHEDPRRTARSLADVLLRYVVRPTRGMTESGHEAAGFFDYIRFTVRLGARGAMALAARFVRANRVLLRLWRLRLHGASARVKAVRRRRMRALGAAYHVSMKRLERLARLQRAPATRSLAAIIANVMLDRVLLATFAVLLTLALALAAPWWTALAAVPLTLGLGALIRRLLPARTVEPSAMLRERSLSVAKLFPAAFVVMGHTHLPEMRANERTTYVNLGAWAEEDAPDGDAELPAAPATRTHLVVLHADDGVMAELRTWRSSGPEPFAGDTRLPNEK